MTDELVIKPAPSLSKPGEDHKLLHLFEVSKEPLVQKLLKDYRAPRRGARIVPHVVFLVAGKERPFTDQEKDINRLFVLDLAKSSNPAKIQYYLRRGQRRDGSGGGRLVGYYLPENSPSGDGVLTVKYVDDSGKERDPFHILRDEISYHGRLQDGAAPDPEKAAMAEELRSLKARVEKGLDEGEKNTNGQEPAKPSSASAGT